MKKAGIVSLLMAMTFLCSCEKKETAVEILNKTINSIDTIVTIRYKQDMLRTNPGQVGDTIFRYREMYFKRLIGDSIVGVKGHWYFYGEDQEKVSYEDIYDGNRLIRKNNRDSTVLLYDLIRFPEFRQQHFWGHNTLYGMQYSFRYMLDNQDHFKIKRLPDTIIMKMPCFQIEIRLEEKTTMPGFATVLQDDEGSVSKTLFCIDKQTYYPIRMKGENFSRENPEQKVFIDQTYYDILFNIELDDHRQFNTSDQSYSGYRVSEQRP